MVVCLCQGISDRTVRASIESGAHTRQQVTQSCGAGDGCGGCHRTIKTMIVECRRGDEASMAPPCGMVYGDQSATAPL